MTPNTMAVLLVALVACKGEQRPPVARPGTPVANTAPHPPDGQASPLTLGQIARGAQPVAGLGNHHRAITTSSPEAQAYFDQGLRLAYAFNHDEAARSFAHAAELDPSCASCYWGAALVLGPGRAPTSG